MEVITHPSDRTAALVEELETLLGLVKEGEVVDFAFAIVRVNRTIGTHWSETTDTWRLIGAIEALKTRLMEKAK